MNWRAFVAVLLLPATLAAQELPPPVTPNDIKLTPPLQVIPPGEDKIVVLKLKEPAPFEGQLFDPATAMRWAFWLQQWRARYKLDMAQEKNLCRAQISYKDKVYDAEIVRAGKVETDLTERLQRAEQARSDAEYQLNHPGFFESNGFYYALGVVTTGALMGLSFWAATSAK